MTCASFVPIVYFFYPETAGRSLEEIDAIFLESKSIFDTVKVAQRMPRRNLTDMVRNEKRDGADADYVEFTQEKRPVEAQEGVA